MVKKYVSKDQEENIKPQTRDIKIQTIIDFENVPFTTVAEKLFEAKLAKKTRKIYTIM